MGSIHLDTRWRAPADHSALSALSESDTPTGWLLGALVSTSALRDLGPRTYIQRQRACESPWSRCSHQCSRSAAARARGAQQAVRANGRRSARPLGAVSPEPPPTGACDASGPSPSSTAQHSRNSVTAALRSSRNCNSATTARSCSKPRRHGSTAALTRDDARPDHRALSTRHGSCPSLVSHTPARYLNAQRAANARQRHTARANPRVNPGGKVTVAVALEASSVPPSGPDDTTWSAASREKRCSFTTVPTGT